MSIGISSLLDKDFEAEANHVREKVNFLGVVTDCLFSALCPAGVLSCAQGAWNVDVLYFVIAFSKSVLLQATRLLCGQSQNVQLRTFVCCRCSLHHPCFDAFIKLCAHSLIDAKISNGTFTEKAGVCSSIKVPKFPSTSMPHHVRASTERSERNRRPAAALARQALREGIAATPRHQSTSTEQIDTVTRRRRARRVVVGEAVA